MSSRLPIRWITGLALMWLALPGCAQTNTATADDLQNYYWQAKAESCEDCNASGHRTCLACQGVDRTKTPCTACHGADLTKQACASCLGNDQTKLACWTCKGVDQTKLPCRTCNGVDLTKQACVTCTGTGKLTSGARCYSCRGKGIRAAC